MRELEARNAFERKQLIQSLYEYLVQNHIKAEFQEEPAVGFLGESVLEPLVLLNEQNLTKIRLVGFVGGGCSVPGNILHFQYEIGLDIELSAKQMKEINANTELIREGKFGSLFGGKIVGIKWVGQRLAEKLNEDQSIADDLMRCVKSWNHLDFVIEAASPREVYITGPQFTNPGTITELYRAGNKEEIQRCVFGYTIVEKIAGHIKAISS